MERALYDDRGFYRRGEPAAAHFRTSVHASPRYAHALARLLREVDETLGRPAALDLVDLGAGRGELLLQILEDVPEELGRRVRPLAVEVAARPRELPQRIGWDADLPERITGLVIANEWLDNIPVDVAELTPHGPRSVLVDPATGDEWLGGPPDRADVAWLDRWWPLREVGHRAEVGHPRCSAWARTVARLARGVAAAMDYAHQRDARPACGTLAGYRDGRPLAPVPDGSCDITAHVALDACAAAGQDAGATATVLVTQRSALRALGLDGSRPPVELARDDPYGYVRLLARAGEDAELTDPRGLGGFGWLVQAVEAPLPDPLRTV